MMFDYFQSICNQLGIVYYVPLSTYTSQYAVRIQKIPKLTNAINTNLFLLRTLTTLRLDLGIEHVHSKSLAEIPTTAYLDICVL